MITELVVFDSERDRILVRHDGGADTLPQITFPGDWPPMDHRVADAVRVEFGVPTVILEPLDLTSLVLEVVGSGEALPEGYRWVPRLDHPTLGERYHDWLDRRRATGPDARPPWFRPGWYRRASDHLERLIARRGAVRTGPVEQVKQWSMSAVLRVSTDQGRLFLKAVLPGLAREPRVIRHLARRWPELVPTVISSSPEDGWWVATDLGAGDATELPPAERGACLETLATIHIGAASDVGELEALGCPRLSAAELAEQIHQLVARDDLWGAPPSPRNRNRALSAEEYARLRSLEPTLARTCTELEKCPLPETLIHSDFQPTNVILRGEGFGILDWSFATIASPFLDLGSWLNDTDEELAEAEVRRYLRQWRQVVPEDEAWRWWLLAKPLVAVAELKKFVDLSSAVGPDYDFNWMGMVYSWSRRLMNAAEDVDGRIPGWRK